MTAYARSLPALGFDPAPGDVDLTRGLAQRHAQVAQEARQVLALIERTDLSALQGQAANALRVLHNTFPPALRDTASAADTLQAAASSWASQLSGFQAEADALERQAAAAAAHQQALQAQQASLPAGSTVLTADVETAATAVTGISGQAQELHGRYLAAAGTTAAEVGDNPSLWEKTEPVRKVLETVLAPLDVVAADHWVGALKEVAGVPSEWVKEVDESISEAVKLKKAGQSPVEQLIEAANLTERTGGRLDAWETFSSGWLRTAAGGITEIRGLSNTLGGLGLAADIGTVISPQNPGALGWVDRGAATTNGLLIAADLAFDFTPGIGQVALAVTGLYLAGDFLYQHWTPFRDVANDVGHATVDVADAVGHGVVAGGEDIGHRASSAFHSIGSLF